MRLVFYRPAFSSGLVVNALPFTPSCAPLDLSGSAAAHLVNLSFWVKHGCGNKFMRVTHSGLSRHRMNRAKYSGKSV
jgi:hypothetical protein